jgi:hypothetical protein
MPKKTEIAQKTGKSGAPKSAKAKVSAPVVEVKELTSYEKLEQSGIDSICQRVEDGESLRAISLDLGVPLSSANKWIDIDENRRVHYAQARDSRAEGYFEDLDDVSKDATTALTAVEVAGLRLKADNIKWKLARMNAKKYGDKVSVGGADDLPPIKSSLDVALTPTEAYLRMIGK